MGKNHGFDGVFVKKTLEGEVEDIILEPVIKDIVIVESKYTSTGKAYLNKGAQKGDQMSDKWIENTIREMIRSADQEVQQTGVFLRENKDFIRRKANQFSPDGTNQWNKIDLPESQKYK